MGVRAGLIPLAAVLAAAALSSCSSEPEQAAETVSASPEASIGTDPTMEEEVILIDGCGAYYEFDLVRSTVAAGTEDLTKKQKRDLLRDYRGLADGMVSDMEASVAAGDLPQKALDNAARIQANLSKAKTKQGTDGIKRVQSQRIDKSAQRIEALCEAAGDLVPQENLDARTTNP